VSLAAQHGQLQLNAYEPLVAIAILESQEILEHVLAAVRTQCVDGLTVNEAAVARHIEETVGIVTALNPVIGYERATELAAEAYRSGKGILQVVREKHVLTEEQIKQILDPAKLTGLDRNAYPRPKKP
jgi:aspartate ammonia-lyase